MWVVFFGVFSWFLKCSLSMFGLMFFRLMVMFGLFMVLFLWLCCLVLMVRVMVFWYMFCFSWCGVGVVSVVDRLLVDVLVG